MPRKALTKEERVARAVEIARLRTARVSWERIGERFDLTGKGAARIYKTYIAEHPMSMIEIDEHRHEELQMIETASALLLGMAFSKDVDSKGNPRVSPRTKVEALNCLRGWAEHKAKLLGIYAPTKSEVVTIDYLTMQVAQMEAELGMKPGDAIPRELPDDVLELPGD